NNVLRFTAIVDRAAPATQQAAPANAFDLSSMMAATATPISDGRAQADGPTGTTNNTSAAPAFPRGPDFSAAPKLQVAQTDAPAAKSTAPFPIHRGPDFSTAPAPQKKAEDEKLTSQSPIIQLNDFDTKPKLATDEIAKRGEGVAVARKAYRVDGKEITASYELAKGGKIVHTG
ncbi:hypothetical protein GR268_44740, partial [Rhizobium leguminosarum]|nr:hypothetical protein [Rhizobium leguminosarum]